MTSSTSTDHVTRHAVTCYTCDRLTCSRTDCLNLHTPPTAATVASPNTRLSITQWNQQIIATSTQTKQNTRTEKDDFLVVKHQNGAQKPWKTGHLAAVANATQLAVRPLKAFSSRRSFTRRLTPLTRIWTEVRRLQHSRYCLLKLRQLSMTMSAFSNRLHDY